jgi:hypothetical protein
MLLIALLSAWGIVTSQADDNIVRVQDRLKAEGFYSGDPTGVIDRATTKALTQYQIRHGLRMTGKLDPATVNELNTAKAQVTPRVLTGRWERLPDGEMQWIDEPPPSLQTTVQSAPPSASPPPARQQPAQSVGAPPASAATTSPPPGVANVFRTRRAVGGAANPELNQFVERFVSAGVAGQSPAEIKFFADNVDYFGSANVRREEIERDLLHYNRKWPHRRFWIDGDIQIQEQSANQIKLAFPLSYTLRNGSRHASGKVLKSLTLTKTANNDLLITAVSEWKAP